MDIVDGLLGIHVRVPNNDSTPRKTLIRTVCECMYVWQCELKPLDSIFTHAMMLSQADTSMSDTTFTH